MIALFIDESGSFECTNKEIEVIGDKVLKDIVGGVLCFNIKGEAALNSLDTQIKRVFEDVCGEDYFSKIHGKTRVGSLQNRMLTRVFEDKNGYDKMIPFFIKKGSLTKNINSNISDDNTASMLYFNMLNRLVSGILIYYPNFLKDNSTEDIQINIASRRAPFRNLGEKKIKEFNQLGISVDEEYGNSFRLKSSTSVLINLSSELNSLDYLNGSLNVTINEHTINYHGKNSKYNHIFQLADFVCNNAFFRVLELSNEVRFAYDDIDEIYRKIYKHYKNGNLFGYISERCRYEYTFQPGELKKTYDSYIEKLDETRLTTINNVKECVCKLMLIVNAEKYSRRTLKYFIDYLEPVVVKLGVMDKVLMLDFYYILMNVYNHLGEINKNKKVYEALLSEADSMFSINAIDCKLNIGTIYAVTNSNEFNFQGALDIVDELIIVQENIQTMMKQYNELLFSTNINKEYIVDKEMGKLYSSRGQYLSFLKDDSAYESFHNAIKYFGEDYENRQRTISYLIHYIAESKKKIEILDKQLIKEYFQFEKFNEIADYFINMPNEELVIAPACFQLFAFIKLFVKRKKDDIPDGSLNKLVKRILKLNLKELEHPWQLIFFNLAKHYSYDRELYKNLMYQARKICNNKENDITIKLLGQMIEVNSVKKQPNLTEFVNTLKEPYISDYMRNYFELNQLMNNQLSIGDKIDLINSKFTYMYC